MLFEAVRKVKFSTSTALANVCGLPPRRVSNLERGGVMHMNEAELIAPHLDVTPLDLYLAHREQFSKMRRLKDIYTIQRTIEPDEVARNVTYHGIGGAVREHALSKNTFYFAWVNAEEFLFYCFDAAQKEKKVFTCREAVYVDDRSRGYVTLAAQAMGIAVRRLYLSTRGMGDGIRVELSEYEESKKSELREVTGYIHQFSGVRTAHVHGHTPSYG